MQYRSERGFTMVEMAIVLTIIAFIIAGVIGGKALVRSSKMNSIVSDVQGFRSAANLFQTSYLSMPGDLVDARSYWSTTTCPDQGSNTCNGNGDGRVDQISGGRREDLRAWQHMTLAGVMQGTFNGQTATPTVRIGTNVPSAQLEQVGYEIFSTTINSRLANYIRIGTENSNVLSGSALVPTEAESVDAKLDDGKPFVGNVMSATGLAGGSGNCQSGSGSTGVYEVTNATTRCNLYFWVNG